MSIIFREPRETNFRALRDMGLAAWWGSSLGTLASLHAAADAEDDPAERYQVLDRGMKAQRGFMAASVAAYVIGGQLVRFGRVVDSNGVPMWMSKGMESPARAAALAGALASSVAAKRLRTNGMKKYEEDRRSGGTGEVEEAERLSRIATALHSVVPAAVGWLLYSQIKEDARARA
jgi:hypothetical protein